MPLVVPILRLSVLFLNVYETFKTIKLPPPSNRNKGKPSVRAMTQRKRDMKGCLAVWIVWVCFQLYENTVDGIVCMFIPFYDELKSLVLLFMLLTRAKGAEPIYLHVLRPLIKPYTTILDSFLDVTSVFGGFLILLASVPTQYIMSWWHSSVAPSYLDETPQSDRTSFVSSISINGYDSGGNESGVRPGAPINGSGISIGSRSRGQNGSALEDSSAARPSSSTYSLNGTFNGRQVLTQPNEYTVAGHGVSKISQTNTKAYTYPQTRASSASSASYQIWHPPTSASNPSSAPLTQLLQSSSSAEEAMNSTDSVDEWRMYPAFPSAYPPTPLSSSSRLPSIPPTLHHAIPEDDEWRQYEPFPSAYPATPLAARRELPSLSKVSPNNDDIPEEPSDDSDGEGNPSSGFPGRPGHDRILETGSEHPEAQESQGFDRSLMQPQKPLNPSSAGSLSDEDDMDGVQDDGDITYSGSQDENMVLQDDDDDGDDDETTEDDEEEDSFDVSFRTPRPARHLPPLRIQQTPRVTLRSSDRPVSVALTSSSSYQSQSTALSTADNGSSLRTRSSRSTSQSSVSTTLSDAPSVAGKKRQRGLIDESRGMDVRSKVKLLEGKALAPLVAKGKPKSGTYGVQPRTRAVSNRVADTVRTRRAAEESEYDESMPSDSEESASASVPPPGLKKRRIVTQLGEVAQQVQDRRAGTSKARPNPEYSQVHSRARPVTASSRPRNVQVTTRRRPSPPEMSSNDVESNKKQLGSGRAAQRMSKRK